VNGASTASKSKTAAKSGAENGASDHDESDDDKEDEVDAGGAGEAAATGGCFCSTIHLPCSLSANQIITAAKKKKKRKPKKKKTTTVAKEQSNPPRVPIAQLFPNSQYPIGEEVEYKNENAFRTTNEEKRHLDRMNNDYLSDYRQGAEAHRQVRQWAQKHLIKPGKSLHEIANGIEDATRALTGHPGLEEGDNIKGGVGFPTGLSINHCAAHYTPNPNSKPWIVNQKDVLKIDVGIHINGRIVDSAWTMAFDPQYDNLLAAVKDATNTGVREAGIDVRMCDIGAAIQESMESYEVEIEGKTYPVKSIRNLNGHDIGRWEIHGGKSVPIVKGGDQTKMEEGEVFAIETFGSTGKGYVKDDVCQQSRSLNRASLTRTDGNLTLRQTS
jgi:methionyl aminopeptidase